MSTPASDRRRPATALGVALLAQRVPRYLAPPRQPRQDHLAASRDRGSPCEPSHLRPLSCASAARSRGAPLPHSGTILQRRAQLRWQARRRSPNRLGIPYSAGEKPRPRVVGRLAALDRLHATELGRNRQARDTGAARRSPAGGLPPAHTRSRAHTRSWAGARFLAGAGFPEFRRPSVRFPATVPWPAIAQSPAGAVCPAAGLAPDYPHSPRQATARPSMAPDPRPRATARTRSARALAARLPDPPPAEPGGHPRASPARSRPRKRPAGLGSSSRAWFASCLPWQLRREHSTGPGVTVTVRRGPDLR
jgi:hypothetical protein